MHALLAGFVGLVLSAPVVAEPLLEGIVRFASGEPAAVRVRVFDMSDLQRGAVAQATTDPAGYFALPLSALAGRALPAGFTLGPNYPNPFNPSTIIPYQLAASSEVRLEVFNLLGQRVTTLMDGERPAGFHTAMWHATDAAGRAVGAGVYIYRLAVGAASQTGRMVLLDGQAGVSAVQAGSVLPEPASGEAPVYGLLVEGPGLVPYMDPAFRVAAGMAPVELVVSAGSYWSGKAAEACGLCDFLGDAATDSTALVALYEATDGDNWTNNTNWLSDRPLGEWHGVTTDADGRVTWLALGGNQLSGSIPPELANLANLTWLALYGNQLSGSIPPELANLTNLTDLNLGGNQLSGSIPAELGNLTNLQRLRLDANQLSGCVPEGLQNVETNDFSALGLPFCDPAKDGTTDSDAATDRTALVALYEATDGDNWTNNTHWLSDRPLGEWYGVVTNADGRVSWLNLSSNQLSGSIPPELGNLTNLTLLALSANQLSGSIPPELANLTNLSWLYLGGNQLSGCVPEGLQNVETNDFSALGLPFCNPAKDGTTDSDAATDRTALVALYEATDGDNWTNNTHWLSDQPLGEWHGVTTNADGRVSWLNLYFNQLSGSIPPELANLANLTELALSANQLSGSIPPELDNLTNLQRLALSSNQLSGSIPPELGNLTNLQRLALSSNQLSGSIPPELGSLTNLIELNLSSNQLSGSIPSELDNLTNLQRLALGGNQLSGSIPPELGNLANLTELVLSFNQLSGSIPPELGNHLANLTELALSANQLSGSIPPELGNLTNLQRLALHGNQLSGSIPPELGNLTNLIVLALGGNQLSGCISEGLWNVRTNDLSRLDLLSCGPDFALDKAALVALYNATDGANWTNNTNWLSDWPLGEWHGVTTDADGRVARLNLSANQLSGSIPPALGYLANLRALYLGDNQLSGCIPAGLRDLDGGENDLDRLGLFFCEVSSPDLTRPISPPEHMANIWWDWPHKFRVLEIDFTIHNDPGDFSRPTRPVPDAMRQSLLSDVVFYFGLQTNVQRRVKGLIFSRWGTRDLANARVADAVEGWTQSSGHEGDFIGVRRAYDWGAGEYRVRFAPDGSEADGEWFGLWITDKARGVTTWIGSLKFPYLNGEAVLNQQSIYTTVEIYGVRSIRPIDIPEWRVSLKRPLGDGVKPSAATSNYSVFTGRLLNSNVRYDPTDDVMHFQVGGFTERTDPKQQTIFD